jgi:glycosyltransferase involved in cell wall biosynthesis
MGNTLAMCTLIKNEEQYLPYCLASIRDYCDEIIIVDTGSTDRSVEIAKAFGAYVIQAEWKNDFAMIRNISQSCAISDWILWLDGDEVFTDAGIKKIKDVHLLDSTADFFLLPRLNFWKETKYIAWYPDSQYKLYRNNIGLKWQGKIHEKIYDEKIEQHRRRLKHSDVHIFHYAYMKSREDVKRKMENYIKIENPDMDDNKIKRCSTEHSFFYNRLPDGTQEYNGQLPEVFNRVQVTNDEIKVDGKTLIKKDAEGYPIAAAAESFRHFITQNQFPAKAEYTKDLISFVIATYNKIEYVRPLVRDLYNSVHSPFEIIIVNNGSDEDNVTDYLSEIKQQHDNIQCVNLDSNQGFAKGYNAGVRASEGEWICILNNDTLPTDYFAEKLVNFLKEDKEVAMVGPVSNNIPGENQMLVAPAGSGFGDYLAIVEKIALSNEPKRMYSSWLTGCCLMFNRSLLSDLAKVTNPPRNGTLFCEDFLVGQGEDSDLDFTIQHRLHKKLGVERTSFLYHHGQKTLETVVKDWRELQKKNDIVLRKRWPEIFPNG